MSVGGILFIEPHRVAPDVGLDSGGKPVALDAPQQVALNGLAGPVQVTPRDEVGVLFLLPGLTQDASKEPQYAAGLLKGRLG